MFTSKTFWTAIAAIAGTVGLYMNQEISLTEGLAAVFVALQTINFRDAMNKS